MKPPNPRVPRSPIFPRSLLVGIEEADFVRRWFATQPTEPREMLDVGAHRGSSTKPFAVAGWRVHAFEPDPANRAVFERQLQGFDNVTVDERAVGDVDGDEVTLYESEESSGISSLVPFVDSHTPATTVETVRLDTFTDDAGVARVDFLKIDTEGFDLMVLRGFPWGRFSPAAVLCEYEDNKTSNIGYTTKDMLDFLVAKGYTVVVSEWHPIERYGVTHAFKQLSVYDGSVPYSTSWGNLIAVPDPHLAARFVRDAYQILRPRHDPGDARTARLAFNAWWQYRRITRALWRRRPEFLR
ncbi:MAG: FkbM family methyltransferase [Acidimicrobiaceae bacterium]|jgi:FkbM family methyltransferase|nr:FkbM family methyltransferase [Acidimicrobiaceae bacterium]MBT5579813.1 FkbM family methyltransferase [Acidimicrobiaceae bacterium]